MFETLLINCIFIVILFWVCGGFKMIAEYQFQKSREKAKHILEECRGEVKKLINEKDLYKQYEDYSIYENAILKCEISCNIMELAILSASNLPSKPLSPVTAAAIGNSVAGLAGGIVMGTSAVKKQESYEKCMKNFSSTQYGFNGAIEEFAHWYSVAQEYKKMNHKKKS